MATHANAVKPAREIDLRRAVRLGVIFGGAGAFMGAVGLLESLEGRILVSPWFSASHAALLLTATMAGYVAATPPPRLEGYAEAVPGRRNVLAGAIAGVLGGTVVAAFLLLLAVVSIRDIFVAFTPGLESFLAFGRSTGVGMLILAALGGALGTIGGALHLVAVRWRRALVAGVAWVLVLGLLQVLVSQVLRGAKLGAVGRLLYRGASGGLEAFSVPIVVGVSVALAALRARMRDGGPVAAARARVDGLDPRRRRLVLLVVALVTVLILGALPQVLGNFLASVMDLAGIFLLMALGLNIVVGFAGLLDLGYVAFFAVGAYTTAVLTSPTAPSFAPQLNFWVAIPFVMIAAMIAGLVVGAPVIRMRGDYLAIVTLGFGEIARLVVLSDWQKGTLGGAQGIKRIPPISIGGIEFVRSQEFFYLIFGVVVLFAYITYALQNSRVGRAWNAMREDEAVAEATGVNIVSAKLLAFAMGAVMASLGGALFAARVTAVFPSSFSIIVSITVLVIVIVGGMGSVPGVMLGAFVLIGLPELLREFEEFKFLLYGALLIYMMLRRPEGFIPSRRRQRELREEERLQDAWFTTARARGELDDTVEEG